jgi:hypothetical protein
MEESGKSAVIAAGATIIVACGCLWVMVVIAMSELIKTFKNNGL